MNLKLPISKVTGGEGISLQQKLGQVEWEGSRGESKVDSQAIDDDDDDDDDVCVCVCVCVCVHVHVCV